MTFWPLAPGRTRVEVHAHTERAPMSLRGEYAATWGAVAARDVLSEDFSILELQQRGLEMGAKPHQSFGNHEPLLRHLARAVDHCLYGTEPLPAEVIVTPEAEAA